MFQPQPTTILVPHLKYAGRAPHQASPGLLLELLVSLRGVRAPQPADGDQVPYTVDAASVSLPAHGGGRSSRVRTGLGGRIQPKSHTLRPRGERHTGFRGAHRREL